MIIKQCQFSGADSRGVHVHLVHPGYDNDHLVKLAAASPPQLEQIQRFLRNMSRADGTLYTLVSALGAGEFWGSNSNADWFGLDALLHVPPGWDLMPVDQQKLQGQRWQWGYPTFYNAYAYQHHVNKDPERAFGTVEYVLWDPRMKRVLLVVGINRRKAQQLGAQGVVDRIENGEYPDVSMGCKVPFDVCLHPSTLISTYQGLRPISEVRIGDLVHTHRGRLRRVTNVFERQAESTLELHPAGVPDPLVCTENHPVLIVRKDDARSCHGSANGQKRRHAPDQDGVCSYCKKPVNFEPAWIEAENVQVGDYMLTPVVSGDQSMSPDLARLMGYYLGDGSPIRQRRGKKKDGDYVLHGLQFSANEDEDSHLSSLIDTMVRLGCENEPKVYQEGQGRKAVSVRVYDQSLAHQVIEVCGEGSRGKHLPLGFEQWNREARLSLLAGLIDTDGSQDHNTQEGSIRYVTVNQTLALSVRDLCFSLGIPASVQRNTISSGFVPGSEAYWVLIPGSHSDILSQYSCKVRPYEKAHSSKIFFWNGYACSPVRSIRESDYVGTVYNLAVEEDESYVAGGEIVHNCSICGDMDLIQPLLGKPMEVVRLHRERPIRGVSVTTQQYCQHLKFELNKIYPDGRRVMMLNIHPRFFDISFVFIGADKTSKMLAKLAAGQCPIRLNAPICKQGCTKCNPQGVVPSYHVHDVWNREKAAMSLGEARSLKNDLLEKVEDVEEVLGNLDPESQFESALKKAGLRKTATMSDELIKEAYGLEEFEEDPEEVNAISNYFRQRVDGRMVKKSEIAKRVASHFGSRMPSIERSEPDIPHDVQDEMAEDLPNSLSTAGGLGIVVKPREFQRMILIHSGHCGLADDLDRRGMMFRPGAPMDRGFSMGDAIIPRILSALMPMLQDRSAFGPVLHRRIIIVGRGPRWWNDVGGCPRYAGGDLMDKISSAYTSYRRGLIYKTASLVPRVLHQNPEILNHLFGGDLVRSFGGGLVKEGGDVMESLIGGMLPVIYLNQAHFGGPVSRYVQEHLDLDGLTKAGGLAACGGLA